MMVHLEYWVVLYQFSIALGLLTGRAFPYIGWLFTGLLLLSTLVLWFWWYVNFGDPRSNSLETATKISLIPAFLLAWILALLR
jgi:hypothetical protein